MADLNIASFNVQGFNVPEKRAQILHHLHKRKAHVVCLQETHFKSGHAPLTANRYFPTWFCANNPDSRSKGVAIALHKSLTHQVTNVIIDPQARYIILTLLIGGRTFTFINVYAPNQGQCDFLVRLIDELLPVVQGTVVLCGDLNLTLDPTLDNSTGRSSISYAAIKRVKRSLALLNLKDA